MKIQVIKVADKAVLPEYQTEGSAALDLHAMLERDREPLLNGQQKLIRTGLKIHIKDPGYVGIIVPRSGLGHKEGIVLGNGTGVIDSDYQGEVMVSLRNQGAVSRMLEQGERIAQILFVPVARIQWEQVDSFEETDRGEGGFGSTGTAKKKAVKKKAATASAGE